MNAQNTVIREFGTTLPVGDDPNGGLFPPSRAPAISKGLNGKIWFVKDDTNPPSYTDFTVWRDGSITFKGVSREVIRLLRLTSNGSLDTSFGADGVQVIDNPFGNTLLSLLEARNGKILLVGLERGSWSVKQLMY